MCYPGGNSPLHFAACNGNDDVIQILVRCGASIEEQNENGHTPLMDAANTGHISTVRLLLDAGADINAHSNEFKETALTLAAYKGSNISVIMMFGESLKIAVIIFLVRGDKSSCIDISTAEQSFCISFVVMWVCTT